MGWVFTPRSEQNSDAQAEMNTYIHMRGPISARRNWGWTKKALLGDRQQFIPYQHIPVQNSKDPKNSEKRKFEIYLLGCFEYLRVKIGIESYQIVLWLPLYTWNMSHTQALIRTLASGSRY